HPDLRAVRHPVEQIEVAVFVVMLRRIDAPPDAGEIRLAVGGARRGRGEIRLAVGGPRRPRQLDGDPLRRHRGGQQQTGGEASETGAHAGNEADYTPVRSGPPRRYCFTRLKQTEAAYVHPS